LNKIKFNGNHKNCRLPETNIAPARKLPNKKEIIIVQPSICRSYIRETKLWIKKTRTKSKMAKFLFHEKAQHAQLEGTVAMVPKTLQWSSPEASHR